MDEEVLPLVMESDWDDDVVETRLDVRLDWPRTGLATATLQSATAVLGGEEEEACCAEGVSDTDEEEEVDTVDSAN